METDLGGEGSLSSSARGSNRPHRNGRSLGLFLS